MSVALAGIKVVEAASYVTGPFAAQPLADMGTEVIKIEEPKLVETRKKFRHPLGMTTAKSPRSERKV